MVYRYRRDHFGTAHTPLRNPYFPVSLIHPPFSRATICGMQGPIITLPSSHQMKYLVVLWLQTHHEQPILGGLGDHITSRRPSGFDSYVASRTVLKALSEISVGRLHQVTIEPNDVDALIADGFEWIVVDPANFSPGLEAKWALHSPVFAHKFGVHHQHKLQVDMVGEYKMHQPVVISDIAPVERLGVRTEEAPPAPQ